MFISPHRKDYAESTRVWPALLQWQEDELGLGFYRQLKSGGAQHFHERQFHDSSIKSKNGLCASIVIQFLITHLIILQNFPTSQGTYF